jgi:hypothetical protein
MTELAADRLPSYVTRFIGREREIDELNAMLEPSGLVNICGVGGLGKTRLAIEVVRRLSGVEKPGMDVFWVPLIGVSAPAELATAIGQGIGMHGLSGDEPLAALVAALGMRRRCWCSTTASTLQHSAESSCLGYWPVVRVCGCWRRAVLHLRWK